ncbi:hypothetical protein GHT06_009266 [Daphnia sinensis]|uniref:Uncharacterized protein n=1 Tax=Daphnia sinensis TaxID=1820382 RepID=A0AAD5L2P0_9CRUS|nr:hypothetical protein GHT06_009266 [Daphnia sinensis]
MRTETEAVFKLLEKNVLRESGYHHFALPTTGGHQSHQLGNIKVIQGNKKEYYVDAVFDFIF